MGSEILSGLWSLGGFRGVLFHPSMGPGSLDPCVATITLGLLWPSLVGCTCPSVEEMELGLPPPPPVLPGPALKSTMKMTGSWT